MKREPTFGTAGAIALAALLAGAAFFLLRGGTVEVTVDHGPEVTPPESGAAVIGTLRESGGFSLFGLRFADSTHIIEVRFTTEPGCSDMLTPGEPWPSPHPECTGPAGVVGEVGGLGLTPSGRSIVGVEMTVARDCYRALEQGMPWPTDVAACNA